MNKLLIFYFECKQTKKIFCIKKGFENNYNNKICKFII